LREVLIVREHVSWVPAQSPPHPVNVYPVPGEAVSVTGVLVPYDAAHVVPQLIPAGLLVTVPVPVVDTVSVCTPVAGANKRA